jgi:hypothetical protein
MRQSRTLLLVVMAVLASALPARAQDPHVQFPVSLIENLLRDANDFTIIDWRGSRAEGDRTARVTMAFPDETILVAKWASAPANGAAFNNEPRYEVAAYEIQKLFLDEPEYVVPVAVMRSFPLAFIQERDESARETFRGVPHVVVQLQYWLSQVSQDNVWDPRRLRSDDGYAHHMGNLNLLTYLIRHRDANIGNILIAESTLPPRLFSIDNGVAFRSLPSTRGTDWERIRVERVPEQAIARLRQVTLAELTARLAVLAEFEIRGSEMVAVPAGANLDARRGVRRSGDRIQFGLTDQEIREIDSRLRSLLRDVDSGKLRTFQRTGVRSPPARDWPAHTSSSVRLLRPRQHPG